jgi:CheY-like chemotaxis protein
MSKRPLAPLPGVQPPGRQERRDTKLAKKRDTTLLTGAPALRVLLVEDDPDVTEALAALLRAWGHEVCAVVDGAAALHAAATFLPDVVLSDIGLPEGMDGCEVARQLRGNGRLLIALSGGGQESRLRASAAGFDCFLAKPCNFQELRRLLATVVPRR